VIGSIASTEFLPNQWLRRQVAMKLDIETGEVDRLYREFWKLKGLNNLQVYAEIKGSISTLVKLYQLTKQAGMKTEEVVNTLKIVEQLPRIKDESQCIKDNVYALRSQRHKLENDLYILNKQKASSTNELESLHEDIDKLKYERHELSSLIAQLKNDSALNTIGIRITRYDRRSY
jgi:chromosome segregation ATPase